MLLVTNPFHQLRSVLIFGRAASDLGLAEGFLQLSVAEVPFGGGHKGFGGPLLDAAVDLLDIFREGAALVYYKMKGYI